MGLATLSQTTNLINNQPIEREINQLLKQQNYLYLLISR